MVYGMIQLFCSPYSEGVPWYIVVKNTMLFHHRRPMTNVPMIATILALAKEPDISVSPNERPPDDDPKEVAPFLSSMP